MNKKIVCYFSATGNTRLVAEKIKNYIDCDIFEIEPLIKYTSDDLDWRNEYSRSSIEMSNKNQRPSIKNKVINLDKYDTIILGYPIWWYTNPTIINTFIEENNLENKDIYIFATSGSSLVLDSFNDLKNNYPNLRFINAKRFNIEFNDKEIDELLEKK